jgi:hypothetical protein
MTKKPDAYDFDAFVTGYLSCAVWTTMDAEGNPLDDTYSTDDLTRKARAEMRRDCRNFIQHNLIDLQASGLSADRAGHDFWLTRNGHGAGFWDEGIGNIGDRLTAASKPYGSVDLYVYRKRLHHS